MSGQAFCVVLCGAGAPARELLEAKLQLGGPFRAVMVGFSHCPKRVCSKLSYSQGPDRYLDAAPVVCKNSESKAAGEGARSTRAAAEGSWYSWTSTPAASTVR